MTTEPSLLHGGESTGVPDNVIDTTSQLTLHAVGVAATTCISPGDHGTILLHCGECVPSADHVANTISQLIPNLVGAPTTICNAPGDDGTIFLQGGKSLRVSQRRDAHCQPTDP